MAGVDVLIAEDSRIQAKILQKRLTDIYSAPAGAVETIRKIFAE